MKKFDFTTMVHQFKLLFVHFLGELFVHFLGELKTPKRHFEITQLNFKKLPTWGRGVSKSEIIADVVYGCPKCQKKLLT